MPGPSQIPDLLVEIAFTPDPFASYLAAAFTYGDAGTANDYLYVDMTSIAGYTIQAGDVLEYDVYVPSTNAAGAGVGGMDIESATQAGRSFGSISDAYGALNNPTIPRDQWVHRATPISAMVGQTIILWELVAEQDRAAVGTATARYRDIYISDGAGTVKFNVWRQLDQLPTYAVALSAPAGGTFAGPKVGEAPVWTDVTPYFFEAHPRRGRQRETDRIEAGTVSLVLDNRDRRFDPTNTGSPYYPNVLPMRRVRISGTFPGGGGGTTYRRFTGFIERWPPTWQGKAAEVALDCTDAFEPLGVAEISGFRAVEQSGARVNWVLDLVGWPAADRSVDTGNSQVEQSGSSTGTLLDNAPALGHLQDVAEAELGTFFISGDGKAVFQQRQRRLTAPYNVSQGTFSNAPGVGEFLYLDPQPNYDKDDIWNDVRSRPVAATTDAVAADYASQPMFGRRTQSESIWLTTLTECLNRAQYLLARHKQPSERIDGITLEPQRQDTLWPQVLQRELGDRITVKLAPYGGGPTITRDVYIESIQEDIVARDGKLTWSAKWSLSPADVQAYWVLGDANLSLLGGSTTLAY